MNLTPIVLYNNTSSASPAPFQQMLIIPANTSINSTYTNIRFRDGNYKLLTSWLESYTTSSATIWIVLPNGISSKSAMTIYMETGNLSDNFLDGVTVGEAPQLSGTYGQYDNGAKVFSNYWNFAGTSLPSGWETLLLDTTVSVNNGIIFDVLTSGDAGDAYFSDTISTPSVIDMYVKSSGGTDTAAFFSETDISSTNLTNANINNGYVAGFAGSPVQELWKNQGSGYAELVAGTAPFSFPAILTLSWGGTGILASYYNYGYEISSTDSTFSVGQYLVGITIGHHFTGTAEVSWLRVRAYPPNGTMPIQVNELSSTVNITEGLII